MAVVGDPPASLYLSSVSPESSFAQETDRAHSFTNKRSHRLKLRIATFGGLVMFIAFFAPHQFAFLVLFLLQGQTALKSLVIARKSQVRPFLHLQCSLICSAARDRSAAFRNELFAFSAYTVDSTAECCHTPGLAAQSAGRMVCTLCIGSQYLGHHWLSRSGRIGTDRVDLSERQSRQIQIASTDSHKPTAAGVSWLYTSIRSQVCLCGWHSREYNVILVVCNTVPLVSRFAET